jgi:uncharacterized protein (TIGR03089 family)
VSSSPAPADVPALLRALLASDPGRPRVTWYGADGERVELSARVLDNWVAKTANLLAEELDAGPGTRVRLDLPPHWRTAVWALAVWAVGAEVAAASDPADVVVTAAPAARGPADGGPADGVRLVVVALPALARSAEHVPPGAVDYNAEVSGFGDVFAAAGPTTPVRAVDAWPRGVRLLVTPDAWDLGRTLVAPLAADGSVVLSDGPPSSDLARNERVTARA